MNLLERLRAQPRHVKGQYAFAGALSATLLVALVWSASLPARFSGAPLAGQAETRVQEEADVGFTDLVEVARTQLGNVVGSTEDADGGTEQGSVTNIAESIRQAEQEGRSVESGTARQEEPAEPGPATVLIGVEESEEESESQKEEVGKEAPEEAEKTQDAEEGNEPPQEVRTVLIGTTTSSGNSE